MRVEPRLGTARLKASLLLQSMLVAWRALYLSPPIFLEMTWPSERWSGLID